MLTTIFLIALAVLLVSGILLITKIATVIVGVLIVIAVIRWLFNKFFKRKENQES